jgi:hypothetical protein
MKFTFKSEQCGATFEMTFEEEIRDDIELMFEQFMRGSGFHFIEDEDMYTEQENSDTSEECVHESDISATADKTEISGITDDDFDITAVHSPDGNEVRITLTPKNTADKPWVGLSDEEAAIYSNMFNGIRLIKSIEALLKERNNG